MPMFSPEHREQYSKQNCNFSYILHFPSSQQQISEISEAAVKLKDTQELLLKSIRKYF